MIGKYLYYLCGLDWVSLGIYILGEIEMEINDSNFYIKKGTVEIRIFSYPIAWIRVWVCIERLGAIV